jgi:uncharacterized protein
VAYSGGVDSLFLAWSCHQVLGKSKYLACLGVSPSLAKREYREALQNAGQLGLNLETFKSGEFQEPEFIKNGPDRCYHCKGALFKQLHEFRTKKGFKKVLYGGNQDDLGDYRPGHKAAEHYGAEAPMALVEMSKSDIRSLSRLFNLPTAEKPAMPCLSSRIPYGSHISLEKLAAVESGEDLLKKMGFSNFRVRHEGDIARIEVPHEEFGLFAKKNAALAFSRQMKQLGFKRILLDLEGLRSGNLNESIHEK